MSNNYSLFNNPWVDNLRASLPPEELQRMEEQGKQMYKRIDFDSPELRPIIHDHKPVVTEKKK